MWAFRKSGADISLCREWFTTRPVQSTIGLRAIVPMVIVRKGIVLGDSFAGAANFSQADTTRWVHTFIDTIGR
jgi:thioester reductase-like protein